MPKPYEYDSEAGQTAVKKAANTRDWVMAQVTTSAAIAAMVVVVAIVFWYLTT